MTLTLYGEAAIRAMAIAAAVLLSFGAVFLREATSPSGEGYWTAMAAAPGGGLYVADELRRQLVLVDGSGAHPLGSTPLGIYRALAADSTGNLLLGTESGLFVSNDSGAHWRFAIPSRRFTTVSAGPDYWLAGAWNDGLYRSVDHGATWTKASLPAGDVEFEQVIPGFAATLLGLLHSGDGGQTWQRLASSGDRMTAVAAYGDQSIVAGDWYGRIWTFEPGPLLLHQTASCKGGIWSLALAVIATTQGLCPRPRSGPALLTDHEITRVVVSGITYYAAVARGGIYVSDGGDDWRFAYQP